MWIILYITQILFVKYSIDYSCVFITSDRSMRESVLLDLLKKKNVTRIVHGT